MTKYEIVIKHIKQSIKKGDLEPGDKLPSIRDLAKHFECSNATIIRAYVELERMHMIYSINKSGYYVLEKDNGDNNNSDIVDMVSASPSAEVLPYVQFQHCLNQAIDQYKDELFSYSDPQGLFYLRQILKKSLQNYQVFTKEEHIYIVSGSQQAIDILTKIPFPNGKENVLIEQPTYKGIIKSLELNGVKALGISRKESGMDFDELERIFRTGNIKFFYTVPRYHNPTGLSYTKEEKKEILRLAVKYNVYIVEDDYLADLEVDTKQDPIYSYDIDAKTIYIKSYSKILLPGLRIAAVILPQIFSNTFLEYKYYSDFTTSVLSQGALEIYLRCGMFDAHRKKINRYYYNKIQLLNAAIENESIDNVGYTEPMSGFFSCIRLPENIEAEYVVNKLVQDNIYTATIKESFLNEFYKNNYIRLSIAKVKEEQIQDAVSSIFNVIDNIKSRYKPNYL